MKDLLRCPDNCLQRKLPPPPHRLGLEFKLGLGLGAIFLGSNCPRTIFLVAPYKNLKKHVHVISLRNRFIQNISHFAKTQKLRYSATQAKTFEENLLPFLLLSQHGNEESLLLGKRERNFCCFEAIHDDPLVNNSFK